MRKQLYFTCPTDCLEPIINDTFKQENFYCTSLGNSLSFNVQVVSQIKKLIITNEIKEISFVLSIDNRIVLDALRKQDFSEVQGLSDFYGKMTKNKKHSEASWQKSDLHMVLSYHLNSKIKELKHGLDANDLSVDQLKITGKIYNRKANTFDHIYSDLICLEYLSLN